MYLYIRIFQNIIPIHPNRWYGFEDGPSLPPTTTTTTNLGAISDMVSGSYQPSATAVSIAQHRKEK
jgi:hypothetical protein